MVQRIVVGLDGSPLAEAVLPYAAALAKALNADITLLTVTHLPEEMLEGEHASALEQIVARAETLARDYLRGVEERLRADGVRVASQVGVGDAPAEIVRCAGQSGADLIALATHGRSGIQRWMYGSVAEEVLHTSRIPVLLVRPPQDGAPARAAIDQLVVPLDGSELAEAALAPAELLATALKAPVVLLRAIEPVYLFGDPVGGFGGGYADLLDGLKRAADEYLARTASGLREKGIRVQVEAPMGLPAREIVRLAQARPGNLVVMATHGRTGLAGVVLGSVARRVVQEAGAPVLLVRPVNPAAKD